MEKLLKELMPDHGNYIQTNPTTYLFESGLELRGGDIRGEVVQYIFPPEDEIERLRAVLRYFVAVKEQEETDFQHYRREYAQQAQWHAENPSFCPSPPANAVEMLQAGRERIMELRMKIIEIEEQLPDVQRQQTRQENAQENFDRSRMTKQKILGVQI